MTGSFIHRSCIMAGVLLSGLATHAALAGEAPAVFGNVKDYGFMNWVDGL